MEENNTLGTKKKKLRAFSLLIDSKIFVLSFLVYIVYYIFSSGLIDFLLFEKHDKNFMAFLSGMLSIDYVAMSVYPIVAITSLLLIFYISLNHINLKNKYYIYYAGRKNNFYKTYIRKLFKSVNKAFISHYLGYILFILVIFLINFFFCNEQIYLPFEEDTNSLNIFTFGSRFVLEVSEYESINVIRSLYLMPNLLCLVILWIPVYFAVVTYCYMYTLINEFTRNIVFTTLISICFYFFLNPILKITNLEILEPVHFASFLVKGYIPMQFLMITGCINLLILIVINIIRRGMKTSEI